MIIRSVAVRQGRRALCAPPISQLRQRSLSSTTTTTTTTTTEAPTETQTPSSSSIPQTPQNGNASTPSGQPAWGRRTAASPPDTVAQDYVTFSRLQRKTSKLGSAVEKRYAPGDLIKDPPSPKDLTLELLLASQTHLGHHTSLWNPANSRYIHGVRAGVHIISLEQTAVHLRRAARVVEEVAYRGGLILFVGTRKGQVDIVVRAAQLAGACHLFTKWTPGTITNRDQILRDAAVRMVNERDELIFGEEEAEAEEAAEEGKSRDDSRRSANPLKEAFDHHVRDRRPLAPDLVVVLNPLENHVLLHECAVAAIPTIGVIDTDMDPSRVTYAVPANDDSLRSVAAIGGVLGRAGEIGQKRRLRDAAVGKVTWQNDAEVRRFFEQQWRLANPEKAAELAREARRQLPPRRILISTGQLFTS